MTEREVLDVRAPEHWEQWLDAHHDAPPALRRLVLESRDGVRRALLAQEADRRA